MEASSFITEMGQMGVDILAGRPSLHAEGLKHVAEVDTILNRPEFAATNAAFEQYKLKSGRPYEPEWYNVLGKRSVRAIAKDLQRLPEYVAYYGKGSRVVHSSSYKDQLKFTRAGAQAHSVRYVADISTVLNFAFTNAMLVFHRVLGFYRNDELPAFGLRYVSEWRSAFTTIPHIKIVSE